MEMGKIYQFQKAPNANNVWDVGVSYTLDSIYQHLLANHEIIPWSVRRHDSVAKHLKGAPGPLRNQQRLI